MILNGLKIIVTDQAYITERVKKYSKRKAKSESHWKRMDKKWLKRHGHKQTPRIFLRGNAVYCHPALYSQFLERSRIAVA